MGADNLNHRSGSYWLIQMAVLTSMSDHLISVFIVSDGLYSFGCSSDDSCCRQKQYKIRSWSKHFVGNHIIVFVFITKVRSNMVWCHVNICE